MILTLLSKGRFSDQAYLSLCIRCPFGISGLKLHTVASDELELWKSENWSFHLKLCVTMVLYGDCSLWAFPPILPPPDEKL